MKNDERKTLKQRCFPTIKHRSGMPAAEGTRTHPEMTALPVSKSGNTIIQYIYYTMPSEKSKGDIGIFLQFPPSDAAQHGNLDFPVQDVL